MVQETVFSPPPLGSDPLKDDARLSEEYMNNSSSVKQPSHHHEADNIGTPSPCSSAAGSITFEEKDYSKHLFYGPATDNPSTRALHGLRKFCNSDLSLPHFASESAAVDAPTYTSINEENTSGDLTEVIFDKSELGFGTKFITDDDDGGIRVHVEYVDSASPASRAGVQKDDVLISVNSESIDSTMTQEQIISLVKDSTLPKRMLFLRISEKSVKTRSPLKAARGLSTRMLTTLQTAKNKTTGGGRFSKFANAKKLVNNALAFSGATSNAAVKKKKATTVHSDTTCSGCFASPIIGDLYTCSVCVEETHLCEDCYAKGIHGMEGTDAINAVNKALIHSKLLKSCNKFTDKFLISLRIDICDGVLSKFDYMGTWLASVIGNTPASKISVRGIEVPRLKPDARQEFVSQLLPLASNRTDIEVNVEWLADSQAGDTVELEKLRIWISDKKTRCKSPFAPN